MCYEMCGPDVSNDPAEQAEMDKDYADWIDEQFPDDDYEEDTEDGPEELSESEADDKFQDFMNELNPTVTIAGLDYDPARVLKEVDPIAYRQEFLNWVDSESEVYVFPWNE